MLKAGAHAVTIKQLRAVLQTSMVDDVYAKVAWGTIRVTRKAMLDALNPAMRSPSTEGQNVWQAKLMRVEVVTVGSGDALYIFDATPTDPPPAAAAQAESE